MEYIGKIKMVNLMFRLEKKKKLIEYQKKCLFVTHSPKEMKMMCDNKLKIKRGRLE